MKRITLIAALSVFSLQTLHAQNTLDNLGLTSSTPASLAFSLRKLSTAYSGPAIKVRRASDNAEADMAFDGSTPPAVSASSNVTLIPGVTVGASLGTAKTGTITTTAAKTGNITVTINKTGAITTAVTSTTVTGTGTAFSTELVAGDLLFHGTNGNF